MTDPITLELPALPAPVYPVGTSLTLTGYSRGQMRSYAEESRLPLLREIEKLRAEKEEHRDLMYAEMKHKAQSLTTKIEAIVRWLEQNQSDVFSRGLWGAIDDAIAQQATQGEKAS